jgi:hypothetical protein
LFARGIKNQIGETMSTTAAQPTTEPLLNRYKESYEVASKATAMASTIYSIVVVTTILAVIVGVLEGLDGSATGWMLTITAVVTWMSVTVTTSILRVLAHSLRALCDIARLSDSK